MRLVEVEVSQVISLVALVVSLSAAVFSARLSRRSFKVTAYHGASDRALQLDQVFIAHPLLRPYFSDGEPPPPADGDPELHHRIRAVAEFVADILEDCWDNEDCYAGEDRDAWMRWIYEVFQSSPAACELYVDSVSWYPKLTELFRERGAPTEQMWEAIEAEPAVPRRSPLRRLSRRRR